MGRLTEQDAEARRRRELADGANAADFSEALARGLAILEAFGSERRRMTQAELAREVGLSRATVRRAVLTLEHLGYLTAEGRSYQLSPSVLRLAGAYLTSNIASAVVQPVCDRICEQMRASCSVAVLDGTDAAMIARAVPHGLIAAGGGLGFRVPAHQSALGRVLLAHRDIPEDTSTAKTPSPAEPVLDPDAAERIRDEGHCYVANEVQAGFHSIAVPVRRWDGRVIAAMNVGCPVEQIPREDMTGTVLDTLREHAERLSPQLI